MAVAFEILVAVAVALVVAVWWAAAQRRLSEPTLVRISLGLLAASGAAAVALVVDLATGADDSAALAVCAAALALAAGAAAGSIALVRLLAHAQAVEEEETRSLARIDETLDRHAAARTAELERTLARERTETSHLLLEQEQRLRDERTSAVEQQVELARTALVEAVAEAQQRAAQRLHAWSSDIERAQRELKARHDRLVAEQAEALTVHEARLAEHAREVQALTGGQHATIERLRADFAHHLAEAFAEAQGDVDAQAGEQRRILSELTERLRGQSRSLREEAEREEAEARARLAGSLPEIERRVIEQLQRSLDRATDRLVEEAERRFDVQVKQSREATAARLARELEKALEHFSRQAEKDVEARMTEVAQATARRLQRQLDEVVRGAETQTTLAEERIAFLTSRFEKAVEDAAGRLAAFETDLELELSTKLSEFERAFRHAEQTVGRETS